MNEINWVEDAWFEREHAPWITQDFKDWWEKFYGHPDQCLTQEDRDEYWVRCGFAWMGWQASFRQYV
jgi:hypothetical protein